MVGIGEDEMTKELGALPGDKVRMLYSNWTVKEVRLGKLPAVILEQPNKILPIPYKVFYSKFRLSDKKGRRREWIST